MKTDEVPSEVFKHMATLAIRNDQVRRTMLRELADVHVAPHRLRQQLACFDLWLVLVWSIWIGTWLVANWMPKCSRPLAEWLLVDLIIMWIRRAQQGFAYVRGISGSNLHEHPLLVASVHLVSIAFVTSTIIGSVLVFASGDTCSTVNSGIYNACIVSLTLSYAVILTLVAIGMTLCVAYSRAVRLVQRLTPHLSTAWSRASPEQLQQLRCEIFNAAAQTPREAVSRDAQTPREAVRGDAQTPHEAVCGESQMPFENASRDDGIDCAICVENFVQGDLIKQLPCKHWYHGKCIDSWLKIRANCPCCRHLAFANGQLDRQELV